jgi:hypothetical protein
MNAANILLYFLSANIFLRCYGMSRLLDMTAIPKEMRGGAAKPPLPSSKQTHRHVKRSGAESRHLPCPKITQINTVGVACNAPTSRKNPCNFLDIHASALICVICVICGQRISSSLFSSAKIRSIRVIRVPVIRVLTHLHIFTFPHLHIIFFVFR